MRRGPTAGFAASHKPTRAVLPSQVHLVNESFSKDNSFNGEDGVIALHSAVPPANTAVETRGGDVVLKNVSIAGAVAVVACPGLPSAKLLTNVTDPSRWLRVPLFVLTLSGGQVFDTARPGSAAANVSGGQSVTAYLPSPLQRDIPPPETIGSWTVPTMHSWSYDRLRSPWQPDGLLSNAVTEYGATPQWINATDDDSIPIQRAIDDSCDPSSPRFRYTVYLPHGEFHLGRPLNLWGCASVVGSGTHSTVLQAFTGHGNPRCWAGNSSGGAMLQSSVQTGPRLRRGGHGILTPRGPELLITDFTLVTATLCPFVDLAAGTVVLRTVGFLLEPAPAPVGAQRLAVWRPTAPYFALRDAVSGRFYGLPLDAIFGGKGADTGGPLHVLVLISGTTLATHGVVGGASAGGIHLYQPSTEHLVNDKQVLVVNSSSVHFHAWKYESALNEPKGGPEDSGSLVWVENCSSVTLFGGSGNYRLYNTSVPMVDVRGSTNVTVMGMVRKAAWNEQAYGLEWLRDDSGATPVSLQGHRQVILYRS